MSYVKRLIQSREDWLEHLVDHYKIKVTRDGDLASLKYDQIESPMGDPHVQECRGMVVHVPTRTVLAHPYNKFWNHGESLAHSIDWGTASVLDKLDGSLMILYFHDGEWRVASSGHPTAGGSFGESTTETFREAFWRIWGELGMKRPNELEACFMFELCAQENRIIVRHDAPRIVLHGARWLDTGREWPHTSLGRVARAHNWELVEEHALTSIDECLEAAQALDPLRGEGYVVVDANFNRVKIKSPRYVVLHHLKGEATPRRAIELWQSGETEEVLANFPEFAPIITPVQEKLDGCAKQAYADFTYCRDNTTSRKDFARLASGKPWAAVMFKLFSSSEDTSVDAAKKILRYFTTPALERLLEHL